MLFNSWNKLLISVILILIVIISAGELAYISGALRFGNKQVKTSQVSSDTHPYSFNIQAFAFGYPIGDVRIYSDDLTTAYDSLTTDTGLRNNKEVWIKAVEKVNDAAIYQNEGIRKGLFEKGDGSLDYLKADKTKEYIKNNTLKLMSLEKVTIFFNNYIAPGVTNPKIGVVQAKAKAFSVMKSLKTKIDNRQYTMVQAGNAIKNMPELVDVDIAYQTNAYQKFEHITPEDSVFDPKLLAVAWRLDKNQVSDILLSKDDTREYYYTIIKITDKNSGEYDSLANFLTKRKNEGLKITI